MKYDIHLCELLETRKCMIKINEALRLIWYMYYKSFVRYFAVKSMLI